jgi:N-acetylglucosaminyldiphosphoundecaprenol N-acetyl-beta-D-mannosaminyltransferase
LRHDASYREAVARADLALPDSGAMVLMWRVLRGRQITRISGLKYLQQLSTRLFTDTPKTLWILPNDRARQKTTAWVTRNQGAVKDHDFYVAPMYRSPVEDPQLVAKIEHEQPRHVIVAIGSGPQEKLGYYLREHLAASAGSPRPAIHCIGAALGFLTGEQVAIPDWADRLYFGWLFRLFAQPRIFIPRLTRALELPWLIARYGREMPPLRAQQKSQV